MVDWLGELLPKNDFYTKEIVDGLEVELWAGHNNPYSDEIMENELYDEDLGLFQFIVPEKNIPRIVVAIREDKKMICYAMLSNKSEFLPVDSRSPYRMIGNVGIYTDPLYRSRGYALMALQKMNQYILRLTKDYPSSIRYAVRTGGHVANLMSKTISLPIFELFPYSDDQRIDGHIKNSCHDGGR